MGNLDKIYLDYANFVISNDYWFRYTDIAIDLGISLDELCKALGLTYEKGDNKYSYSHNGETIRSETKYSIEYLGNKIYKEDSDGDWYKWEYDDNGKKLIESGNINDLDE